MPTETEKAYLAGLLDGEGHVGITVAKLRPNGEWRTHILIVTLANTDMAVLRWAKDILPNGTLVIRKQPVQQLPIGNLRWSSAAAATMLCDLQPYIRIKAKQVAIALEFVNEMAQRERRAKPITEAEWERREDLRIAIRQTNRANQDLVRIPFPSPRYQRSCPHCGTLFNSQGSSRKYCSTHCSSAARWQRVKVRLSS